MKIYYESLKLEKSHEKTQEKIEIPIAEIKNKIIRQFSLCPGNPEKASMKMINLLGFIGTDLIPGTRAVYIVPVRESRLGSLIKGSIFFCTKLTFRHVI